MTITKIGKNNFSYFSPFMGETAPADDRYALGAIEDGHAAGVIVFTLSDDVCVIDWIYVAEQYRRRGIASRLLGEVMELLKDNGYGGCLVYYSESDEFTGFLSHMGFTCMGSDPVCSFSVEDLVNTKRGREGLDRKLPSRIRSLGSLSSQIRDRILALADKAGFDRALFDSNEWDRALSFACVDNDQPEGVILANRGGKEITVTCLSTFPGSDKKEIYFLMVAFLQAVMAGTATAERVSYIENNRSVTDFLSQILKGSGEVKRETRVWNAVASI